MLTVRCDPAVWSVVPLRDEHRRHRQTLGADALPRGRDVRWPPGDIVNTRARRVGAAARVFVPRDEVGTWRSVCHEVGDEAWIRLEGDRPTEPVVRVHVPKCRDLPVPHRGVLPGRETALEVVLVSQLPPDAGVTEDPMYPLQQEHVVRQPMGIADTAPVHDDERLDAGGFHLLEVTRQVGVVVRVAHGAQVQRRHRRGEIGAEVDIDVRACAVNNAWRDDRMGG